MSKTLNVKWKLILTCTVRRVWGSSMLSVNPFTINFHSPSIRQYEFRHVPPTCYWDGRGLVLRVLYCTWGHVCLRKNIHTTQLIKSILPRGLALSCNPSYTWEARTLGWLETERVITPGGRNSVAALYGRPTWEGQPRRSDTCDERRPGCML